jgi:hypothetical protein
MIAKLASYPALAYAVSANVPAGLPVAPTLSMNARSVVNDGFEIQVVRLRQSLCTNRLRRCTRRWIRQTNAVDGASAPADAAVSS